MFGQFLISRTSASASLSPFVANVSTCNCNLKKKMIEIYCDPIRKRPGGRAMTPLSKRAVSTGAMRGRWTPQTRYKLQLCTVSIIKDLI